MAAERREKVSFSVLQPGQSVIAPRTRDLSKAFLALHKSSPSFLSSPSPFIEFVGLQEAGWSCCHVTLTNTHSKTIVFNIRRPVPSYMHVNPKLGWVAPGEKVEIFFSFNGRCNRVPDDVVFYYSIYQLEVDDATAAMLRDDHFSTKSIRKVWISYGAQDVRYILFLASIFRNEGSCRCNRVHNVPKQTPNLDEKGEIVEEEAYNPDEHDDNFEVLPSAEDAA